MKYFLWGVATGVAVTLAIPLVVLGTGMFDVRAAGGPGRVEKALASWAVGASIHWRAPDETIPMEADGEAFSSGLEHYGTMCLQCHGAQDVEPAEFAGGLYPPAPDLAETEMDDGELFWTIQNGIRMTAMPAFGSSHSDDDIWHLVAFIRHLPELTPAEKQTLQQERPGGHHHGESDHGENHHGESSKGAHADDPRVAEE